MKTQYEINESDYRNLSDTELLYHLIGNATYAQELVSRMTSALTANLTRTDLLEIPHIGSKTADSILMAMEFGRRMMMRREPDKINIANSIQAFKIMQPSFWGLEHEELWIIILNRCNTVIKKMRVSIGGIAYTLADTKIILNEVIKCKGCGLLLFHNHPSGNLTPSVNDDGLTENLKQACKYLDTRLQDHIIISGDKYYSYADEDRL